MTPTDFRAFKDAIQALAELLPGEGKPQSEQGWLLYFGALARFPLEVVLEAARQAVAHRAWFPQPATLIEIIEGSPDEQAAAAWSLVYRHRHAGGYRPLVFDDPKIHAAVHALGGWQEVHLLGFRGTESVDVAVKRKQFCEAYKAALLRGCPPDTPKALCADLRPDPALGGPLAISAHTEPAALPVGPETQALPPRAEVEAPAELKRLIDEIANKPVPAAPRRREVVERPALRPATMAEIEDRDRKAREWITRLQAHVEPST